MGTEHQESYRGWTIEVRGEKNMCANYSFAITDPHGKSQHVVMGGDNVVRALERAREMVDLERSFLGE